MNRFISSIFVVSLAACGFANSSDPQVMADGGSGPGVDSDYSSADLVQLTETSGNAIAPQSSVICYAPGAQATRDGTWVRTFRLADWGHAGSFQATSVIFWTTMALNARGILVGLGSYGGPFGLATIDPAMIRPLASVTIDVADVASPFPPEQVVVPITAEVGAGEILLVTVRSPDLQPSGGSFHLGATTSAELSPAYFSSAACAIPYRSTQALGISGHLVIEVIGHWLTR